MSMAQNNEDEKFRLKWEGYIILPAMLVASVFILLGCVYKFGFPETYFVIGGVIFIMTLCFWAMVAEVNAVLQQRGRP